MPRTKATDNTLNPDTEEKQSAAKKSAAGRKKQPEQMIFRALTKAELGVKIRSVSPKGVEVSLVKRDNVDVSILNETLSPFNWKMFFKDGIAYIGIWDASKEDWVEKCDYLGNAGASVGGGIQRCGLVWGIGSELMTLPKITMKPDSFTIVRRHDGDFTTDKVYVDTFDVDTDEEGNKTITSIKLGVAHTNAQGETKKEVIWEWNAQYGVKQTCASWYRKDSAQQVSSTQNSNPNPNNSFMSQHGNTASSSNRNTGSRNSPTAAERPIVGGVQSVGSGYDDEEQDLSIQQLDDDIVPF